jgi:hypothetical protein
MKGAADTLPVKVKALSDFIQMITTEFFKQCIGDDRRKNGFSNHTGSGYCTGIAAFKA